MRQTAHHGEKEGAELIVMHDVLTAPAPTDAFSDWANAYANLCAAERAGADAAATMELTEAVLRARATLRRVRGGWYNAEILERVRTDIYLANYPTPEG